MVILPHRRKAFRGDAAGGVTNISDASYDSKSFLVTVGLNYQTPSSLFFTPDGLTMFMVDNGDNIVTYALSVAWDVSTAVYSSVKDLSDDSGGSENRTGMFFNPIGTLAYFASYGGKDIQRYTMSTGWNLSTIMPDGSAAELATAISGLTDVAFTSDGLKVFYTSDSLDKIYQHTLSSAWDLTTAGAFTEYAFSGSTEPNAFVFNADGRNCMFWVKQLKT